ncbi:agmatinase family protein [Cyclobacterium marinum]|uniref:Arginase/agmatinase/formiminoglutamase n=1 Tax=Cyclobacterium marinum (strain ATCC 25205 / DSM 745 / LMG 13164 / NCIMB 1802) TaxID=880070 RepID=G0J041_CYCMS|nr:agmatinase family protein [Cyclobacterium marinum]AEL27302.1 Arginase/agmatinase/formiminoglutamase [Cyclobacterium marinum DSM 745]
MSASEKLSEISKFDPNGVGVNTKLFGLPFTVDMAEMVILPVPWEVTVTYREGTINGPEAILKASTQVDLFQEDIIDAWKMGITMLPINDLLKSQGVQQRSIANAYDQWLEAGEPETVRNLYEKSPERINAACEKMNDWVYQHARLYIEQGKIIGLLGGDHSTPLGLIRAMAVKHSSFGILQIDAHADLRPAYKGLEYSHASIAHNFMKILEVKHLVQVGVRDLCEQEWVYIQSEKRISLYTDDQLKEEQYLGVNWSEICKRIIADLPEKVYLTIDIDGLLPHLCPNTGTPVPGGLDYQQLMFLIKMLVKSGRQIIGFDLVEVAPGESGDEWDAIVGARILYRVANLVGLSQGKLSWC